jgi:hypothetical protein
MTPEAPTTKAMNVIMRKLYRKGRKVHSGEMRDVLPSHLKEYLTFAMWGLRNKGVIKSLGRPRGYQFISVAFVLLLVSPSDGMAQNQTTFRDSSGSTVGTASTDSGGMVTFRDGRGNTIGTATTDSGGQTTFRDGRGSTTGTATRPTGPAFPMGRR